jgi:hypothetical protein
VRLAQNTEATTGALGQIKDRYLPRSALVARIDEQKLLNHEPHQCATKARNRAGVIDLDQTTPLTVLTAARPATGRGTGAAAVCDRYLLFHHLPALSRGGTVFHRLLGAR